MIETYEALKDLIDTKLNDNDNDILFDTTLFNSGKISYTNKVPVTGTYSVEEKQVVPAHITDINSRYINIPNTNALEASISIEFDMFVRDYLTLNNYTDQEKYKSVSYNSAQLAINSMQRDLLAQKFPLGDSGLYFGGEDSNATIEYSTAFKCNTIYLKVDLKNTEDEIIFKAENSGGDFIRIGKTDQAIFLTWSVDGGDTIGVTYSLGVNEIVVYYDADGLWNLVVGDASESQSVAVTQDSFDEISISPASTTGFEGIVYQLIVDNAIITSDDVSDVETTVSPALINLADFDSRYTLNQQGSYTLTTNEVTNAVLWGSLGNVVFSFEGLVPIGDMFFNDEGYPRQMFFLNIPCLLSKDVLFGNSTEFYLDDVRVYPVDRKTTYGTQLGTTQYIEGLTGTSIVEENLRDLETTFFYKPSRKMNEIFKHIVSNDAVQNEIYELTVQYPFFKQIYNVIIDSGGSSNNLNEFHTFSVSYKNKDASLT